ncbi:hypothetical protein Pelo_11437 [Pelomyxa schiedti]|nr:hypothetical protein Pelo_11437 [Pelomyxa schiedti]
MIRNGLSKGSAEKVSSDSFRTSSKGKKLTFRTNRCKKALKKRKLKLCSQCQCLHPHTQRKTSSQSLKNSKSLRPRYQLLQPPASASDRIDCEKSLEKAEIEVSYCEMVVVDVWFFVVPISAFIVQFFKTMLGMGWGTVLSPVLLAYGYERKEVVISLLMVEFITSIFSGLFHMFLKNNFIFRKTEIEKGAFRNKETNTEDPDPLADPVAASASASGEVVVAAEGDNSMVDVFKSLEKEHASPPPASEIELSSLSAANADLEREDDSFTIEQPPKFTWIWWVWLYKKTGFVLNKYLTYDVRIIMFLGGIGSIGAIISQIVSVYGSISKQFNFVIKLYIGIIALTMGIFTFCMYVFKPKWKFAWWKIFIISIITGFNKGLSGGGSGPVAVTGQMLAGRPERNSIGVTPYSEVIVCGVSTICYFTSSMIQCEQKSPPVSGSESPLPNYTAKECLNGHVDEYYALVPYLLVGALLAIPFGAFVLLGIFSIIQSSLSYTDHWPKIEH